LLNNVSVYIETTIKQEKTTIMNTHDMFISREFSTIKQITPERELLIAILDRAVLDFSGREGELHEKAKEWIFGEEEYENTIFSFQAICEHLGLNPAALRRKILDLKIPKNVSQAHRWLRSKVQSDREDKLHASMS
jgi:hypothetical protein